MKVAAYLVSILIFLSIYVIPPQLFAQQNYQTPLPQTSTPITNPDVPTNLHTWTQSVFIELMATFICQLSGIDIITTNQQCLGVDEKTHQIGFVNSGGGAIGVMTSMIGQLYTQPVTTGTYFSYLGNNFGITQPTYAATTSTGFTALSPVLNIWAMFRNIVYMLFVIIFVLVGLGIMLRVKIDPRTVMGIENQIPKIIIGILLVTFSYAIAGILVDFMWLCIYFIYGIFASLATNTDLSKLSPAALQGKSALGAFSDQLVGISGGGANSIYRVIVSMFGHYDTTSGGVIGMGLGFLVAFLLPGIGIPLGIGIALGGYALPQAIGIIGSFVGFFIILVALFWTLIRVWFTLLKAYVFILIDVVIAPFIIAFGLLPGSPIGFGSWFRDILANLLSFPITLALFLMGRLFMDSFGETQFSGQFVPPFIGNPADPHAIGQLIGLGLILLTPAALEMVRNLLKSPQFKYSTAIGQALQKGGVAPSRLVGVGLSSAVSQRGAHGNYIYRQGPLGTVGKLLGIQPGGSGH